LVPLLTEEDDDLVDGADHGLEALGRGLLDDLALLAGRPVLDQPL
jgi:hypothetical protein